MTIIVTGEYAARLSATAQDKDPAPQWLDTESIVRRVNGAYQDTGQVPGPDCLRPMIELIEQDTDTTNPYVAMTICQDDYRDPGRWWM